LALAASQMILLGLPPERESGRPNNIAGFRGTPFWKAAMKTSATK